MLSSSRLLCLKPKFVKSKASRLSFHTRCLPKGMDTQGGGKPMPSPARARLAVVGDVHGYWHPELDAAALRSLDPNMVVFLGDFGEEDVELVKKVSTLPMPKCCILGNHDAWFTQVLLPRKRQAPEEPAQPAAKKQANEAGASGLKDGSAESSESEDAGGAEGAASSSAVFVEGEMHPGLAPESGVQQQLRALGGAHLGYSGMQVVNDGQELPLSIMGARPFSKGGSSWSSIGPFISALYGVNSSKESAERIASVARGQPEHHSLIIIGHNAPTGLGREKHDIAGVDWKPGGGDHGDPDLRLALQTLKDEGRRVALVLCGHMHHRLQGAHGKPANRRMTALDPTGAVVLNAATVPRVLRHAPRGLSEPGSPSSNTTNAQQQRQLQQERQQRSQDEEAGLERSWRHFLVVDLLETPHGMHVASAKDTWVQVTQKQGEQDDGVTAHIAHEHEVASSSAGESAVTYRLWDAFSQRYMEKTALK